MAAPSESPVASNNPVTPKKSPRKPIPEQHTPIGRNENSAQKFGFDYKRAEAWYLHYAWEAKKFIIGPMPVGEFLSEFLPPPNDNFSTMPDPTNAFKSVPSNTKHHCEEDIYVPLVAALNESKSPKRGSRCPGFVFKDTSRLAENHGQLGSLRPHICLYASESVPLLKNKKGKYPADFGYAELFIEVKCDATDDFCADPGEVMIRRANDEFVLGINNDTALEEASKKLGQNVAYAVETFARQHRAFCFSVSLSGSRARLIHWDHAGATVSASFDIREQPELLCQFFWRFAHADEEARGYDSNVTGATEEEEELFKEVVTTYVAAQRGLAGEDLDEAVGEHYQPKAVNVIRVVDKHGDSHRILVSRPIVSPRSVASRATRGYWAVDEQRKTVCFLKDTWRYNGENTMETEGDILERLHKDKVRHIPELLYHGDVKSTLGDALCTSTQKFRKAPWRYIGGKRRVVLTSRGQYRLVLGTVGYPLDEFSGTKELLHATYDAYEAMIDALNKSHRLHRDISAGNIILVKDGAEPTRRGFLIDWELSCEINHKGEPRDYDRTGTWQFMSVAALMAKGPFAHSIQDDMESILYVVLYCSILWLPHGGADCLKGPKGTIETLFDDRIEVPNKSAVGGSAKYTNQGTRLHTAPFIFEGPIHQWLQMAMAFNHPLPEEKEQYGGKWDDPAHFQAFWKAFLSEKSLPADDKTKYRKRH